MDSGSAIGYHHVQFDQRFSNGTQSTWTNTMSIEVQVASSLRTYCDCAAEFRLTASTVRAALSEIQQQHPALYVSVCDETGTVRRHVNLFVNSTLVRVRDRDGLDVVLEPGDTLTILPAVSGG